MPLIPRDERFYDLFIVDGENLAVAAKELAELLEQMDRLDERVASIQKLEKRGDEIDRDINARLERSFVTPFDREDIHSLVVLLDDVVDNVQATAEAVEIYNVVSPPPAARRLAEILCDQADALVSALRTLEHPRDIAEPLQRIHDLEHEADGLSRAAIAELFRGGLDALEVIKLRELYHLLEEAIDAAEDAGEVIERILAKGT